MKCMRTNRTIGSILALGLVCVFLGCGADRLSGSGSGTSSSSITGVAIAPGGEPAAGAAVYVFRVDEIPSPSLPRSRAIGPVQTDDKGRFDVAVDPNAGYNVTIESAQNKFFRDSIGVETAPVDLGECNLRPVGSLCGTVGLSFGHDPRTVLILVYGSNIFTVPYNESGDFSIDSLAPGDYTVRFMSTIPGYSPVDTVLTIRESSTDTLAHPVALEYSGLYTVSGLEVEWDPVILGAKLSWSALDSSVVTGYNVYRSIYKTNHTYGDASQWVRTPSEFDLVADHVSDTTFIDTSCHPTDSLVIYQLRAVTVAGDEGSTSTCTLTVGEPSWNAVDTMELEYGGQLSAIGMDVAGGRVYALTRTWRTTRLQVYDTSQGFVFTTVIDSPLAVEPDMVVRDSTVYIKSILSILRYDLDGTYAGAVPVGPFLTDPEDTINCTFNVIDGNALCLSTGRGLLRIDGAGSLVCEYTGMTDIFKYRSRPIVQNGRVYWLSTPPNEARHEIVQIDNKCELISEDAFSYFAHGEKYVVRGCDTNETFFVPSPCPPGHIVMIHEMTTTGSLVSRLPVESRYYRADNLCYDQSGRLYVDVSAKRIIVYERGQNSTRQ